MANLGATGNGATLTLATSSLTLAITKIQIGEITVDMLDVSVLGTTDFEILIKSDLKKTPEIMAEFVFVTSATAPTVASAAETGTVTFPQLTGESAAATLAGTGVVTSFKLPDLENGVVQKGSLKFRYDGDTGPTYTKATTA